MAVNTLIFQNAISTPAVANAKITMNSNNI